MIIGVLGTYTVGSPKENLLGNSFALLPLSTAIPLQSLFPSATAYAIDLLQKTIGITSIHPRTFDPRKRLSATECLTHQYLELYHDPEDEPDCLPPDSSYLVCSDCWGPKYGFKASSFPRLLYEEVMSF
ncbi:hypothetical protein B0H14DRAFT_2798190, partial [Mycena olivaceomarginata]